MESATTTALGLTRERSLAQTVRDYVSLTKPRIISLLLLTTVATMIVALGVVPADLDRALDDARRLPGGRRRRGDQPLPRPRARRADGAHPGPAAGRGANRAAPRARLRDRARRPGDDPADPDRERALGRAGARRAARLRGRLHGLAEAADAAEHRHRRRRRGGPAAGRLGGGDRESGARGAVPVRDRLPVDPAALLGAVAADQGRLRAHRRADAAGGQGRGRDPAPDRRSTRWSSSPSPCSRSPPASSARSTRRRAVLGGALHDPRRPPAPQSSRAAALRLYLSSLVYLALLFCAMAVDRVV